MKEIISQNKWISTCIVLLLIVTLGGFLRLYRLGEKSLWVDEIYTYDVSTSGINPFKLGHPAYFLLTWLSAKLGANDFTIRLPSAVLGILGILALFLLGRVAFNNTVGIISAVVLAFWVGHINYSQEARYYSPMFCYSTLSFYFLFLLIQRHYWWAFIPALFFSYLSYLNHPTAAVLFLSTLIFLPLWALLFPTERKATTQDFLSDFEKLLQLFGYKPELKKQQKKKDIKYKHRVVFRAASYVIPIIIFFVAIFFFGRGVIKIALSHLQSLEQTQTPNVEFTLDFFLQHIRHFAPILSAYISLKYLSYLLILIGVFYLIISHLSFMTFYFLLLISTFFALFTVTVGQPYAPKYVYFLAPPVVVGFAGGIVQSAINLSKLSLPPIRASFIYSIIISFFLSCYLIFSIQGLNHYYSKERTDIKGPLKYLKERVDEKDRIVADEIFDYATATVKHYFQQLEFPPQLFLPLAKESGLGCIARALLKRACYYGDDVWFISLWPERIPPELRRWIEKNFLLVHSFPSMIRGNEVNLLKWKYKSSYIYNGNPLVYNFHSSRSINNFTKYFLSEKEWDCLIEATLINKTPQEVKVRINIDGNSGKWHQLLAGKECTIKDNFPISADAHQLQFEGEEEKPSPPPQIYLKYLSIIPQINDNWIIEAEEPDRIHPTWHKKTHKEDDIIFLMLKRNGFADYIFDSPAAGRYKFSLRAKNDKPGPVLLEIAVDDQPMGILNFDRSDNSWQTKSFPIILAKGKHRFCLSFINDNAQEGRGDDEDNDAIIDYLQLQKVDKDSVVVDERMKVTDYLQKDYGAIPGGLFIRQNNLISLAPEWSFSEECKAEIIFDRVIDKDLPILRLYIEPKREGVALISPFFTSAPEQMLYWSVKLRTENLINHSTNACVLYYNELNQPIKIDWAATEGLTRTTEWIRHIYFRQPPPAAKKAAIAFCIYQNSRRPSEIGGNVYIADFRLERLPL